MKAVYRSRRPRFARQPRSGCGRGNQRQKGTPEERLSGYQFITRHCLDAEINEYLYSHHFNDGYAAWQWLSGQLRAAMTPLRLRDLTHQWDNVNTITDIGVDEWSLQKAAERLTEDVAAAAAAEPSAAVGPVARACAAVTGVPTKAAAKLGALSREHQGSPRRLESRLGQPTVRTSTWESCVDNQ